jgi:hypothetical protein
MLKKFFISLIILTTIASEGVINFPGNIYNFLTCLNSEVGQSKNLEILPKSSKNIVENGRFSSEVFKLTENSVQKLRLSSEGRYIPKIDLFFCSKDIFDISSNYLSCKLAFENTFKLNNNTILFKSDTSPPLI